MSTIARAWGAFVQAIGEARDSQQRDADAAILPNFVAPFARAAQIIEQEMAVQAVTIPNDACAVLAQLRGRLESLERDVVPIRH